MYVDSVGGEVGGAGGLVAFGHQALRERGLAGGAFAEQDQLVFAPIRGALLDGRQVETNLLPRAAMCLGYKEQWVVGENDFDRQIDELDRQGHEAVERDVEHLDLGVVDEIRDGHRREGEEVTVAEVELTLLGGIAQNSVDQALVLKLEQELHGHRVSVGLGTRLDQELDDGRLPVS